MIRRAYVQVGHTDMVAPIYSPESGDEWEHLFIEAAAKVRRVTAQMRRERKDDWASVV